MKSFGQLSTQAFLESYGAAGLQETFFKNSVLRSSDGYTYVCGATLNASGNYDMLLTKLNSSNVEIWSVTHAGAAGGDDYAADLVQDNAGNLIITGAEYIGPTDYNAVTIKYNSSGVQQWISSYNGAANSFDGGVALAKDNYNNIYVCGGTFGLSTQSDFLCVKYNSSGAQQWVNTWNGANLQDVSVRLAVSGTTVSVVGGSQQTSTNWKMATVRFNAITGAFSAAQLTGGDDEGIDKVADLAIDASDNTYVVGAVKNVSSGYDIKVIKLNSALSVVWQQTYNGSDNMDDEGLSLELTSTNDVVVCGYSTTSDNGKNFITRKYNGLNGTLLWSKTYDGDGGDDEATALKLDAGGNAILCGSSFKDGNLDYVVQKLKSTNGDILWTGRWNSDDNKNDYPMNLAIDENGNGIYVAGQVETGVGSYKYIVTRWSQKDVYIPVPTDGFSSSGGYVTNRGQLRNEDGTSNSAVKFYNANHRVATYLENRFINYQLVQGADPTNEDTTFRVRMEFTRGNSTTKVLPFGLRNVYHNYYLGHMDKPSERTEIVNSALRLESYPNTDVVFTHSPSGFRHWIVARTGAPTANFEMTFTGQTGLSIDNNGDLHIETSIGDIEMTKAKAYSMNNTTGVLTLLGWQPSFVVNGSAISFANFGNWSGTLVLEFGEQATVTTALESYYNLEWSTYFGGNLYDEIQAISSDEDANCWVAGQSSSLSFSQLTTSNIQSGNSDAFYAKFNSECEAEYLNFFGGDEDDLANGIARDENDNIYLVGTTKSSNLPDLSDVSLDFGYHGGEDGFFAKFDQNGIVLVDSYIGGVGYDECVDIATYTTSGGSLSIYLVGNTGSAFDFEPEMDGFGYSQTQLAGDRDGFVIRLGGNSPQLVSSTYFGGNSKDYITDVEVINKSAVICGKTFTSNYSQSSCGVPNDGGFPTCSAGSSWHQPFFNSTGILASNMFVAILDWEDGALNWSTYIGRGTSLDLTIKDPQIKVVNNGTSATSVNQIFIVGTSEEMQTGDPTLPLLSDGIYNQNFGGGYSDIALYQFDVIGETYSLKWCSYFGGSGMDFNPAIDVNQEMGIICLTGRSKINNVQGVNDFCTIPLNGDFPLCNSNGLGYMETSIQGQNNRAFVATFDLNKNPLWITQFGNGTGSFGNAISSVGSKLFVAGKTSEKWTEWDYDALSSADYYKTFNQFDLDGNDPMDGTIARFDLSTVISVRGNGNDVLAQLQLFPNPSSSSITVTIPMTLDCNEILILNNLGQMVLNYPLNGQKTLSIDVNDFAPGLYLVQTDNSLLGSVKFIKN